jgi:hypothetical protein
VEKGWITLTIPDKPTSKNQQYKTTPDGLSYLDGGVAETKKNTLSENTSQQQKLF